MACKGKYLEKIHKKPVQNGRHWCIMIKNLPACAAAEQILQILHKNTKKDKTVCKKEAGACSAIFMTWWLG